MQNFISCDWGTSSLRVRLIEGSTRTILAGVATNEGIANTYKLWKESKENDHKRLAFYRSVVGNKINEIEKQVGHSLEGYVIIISGMASSSIGMVELPYGKLPFLMDGSDLPVKDIPGDHDFRYETILVSGMSSGKDVMRGEETELTGCAYNPGEERIFIFPGTHSKHIIVRNSRAIDFKTYMTGEFLQLLAEKSILSSSVEKHDDFFLKPFTEGVTDSLQSNLLHQCFEIRTNELFAKFSRQENFDYLCGLLIGSELKDLLPLKIPLTLVSSRTFKKYYFPAMEILKMEKMEFQDTEEAIVRGHFKICSLYNR